MSSSTRATACSRSIRATIRDERRSRRRQLVAQFPVTTGSSHDPLPLGTWKVTTYAFLPPFNYQPDLFWDVERRQGRAEACRRGRTGRSGSPGSTSPRSITASTAPRAADHRQDRKPRLPAADQLGRDAAVADDEARLHGDVRRPRGRMFKIVVTRRRHRGPDQRLLDLVLRQRRAAGSRTARSTRGRRRGDGRSAGHGRRSRSPKGSRSARPGSPSRSSGSSPTS